MVPGNILLTGVCWSVLPSKACNNFKAISGHESSKDMNKITKVNTNKQNNCLTVIGRMSAECKKVVSDIIGWNWVAYTYDTYENDTIWAEVQVSNQTIHIFMEETRCQKTLKYKRNLSMKLFFPQRTRMHLRLSCIHSTNFVSDESMDIIQRILVSPLICVHF